MSRLATQSDVDPFSSRLAMIASNMSRITSQNKKLQELLAHREHLDRLRQISVGSAINWEKLANLAQNVQELSLQARTNRQKIYCSLNRHTDTLNKTLLSQIQSSRTFLSNMESRLSELKLRQKNMLKVELQREKMLANERLTNRRNQCLALLQKAQSIFKENTEKSMQLQFQQCSEGMNQRYQQCRTSLGHLSNLVAYYHWKKTDDYLLLLPAEDIVNVNCDSMTRKLAGIELNQKRVKGQIDWLKSKAKKRKNELKSQNQDIYQPMQEAKAGQLAMSIDQLQYQLIGLGRICDYETVIQKNSIDQSQVNLLVKVRSRLQFLSERQQQYSSFYKSKN